MPTAVLPRLEFLIVFVASAFLQLIAAPRAHAEAAGKITLPPGFRSELVYSVPLATQGSWVSLTIDDKGRLIACDQLGSLYRISPSALGQPPEQTKVEALTVNVGFAQGLLFHDGKLYVVQNGRVGAFTSGLYRLTDSNNDDRFDRIEQLRILNGEGEHGPHAVVLSPDGKKLFVCCGNSTALPLFSRSLAPPIWAEDQLLDRIGDPHGHASTVKAPGGWIARMDLDGNELELFSVGYRNMYDMAFNADGELFTFDSDMEWDIGTPWYRPPRVCHVTSGSDMGWRGGNGVWPPYYPDTLPNAVESGPASPTGMAFGYGTKFPPKYQQALYAGDWSYGNIFVVQLKPHGASYRGEMERFASAMPLGVTDMVVRPQDGGLYFTVGGRQSESALYRIVWSGEESPAQAGEPAATDAEQAPPASTAPQADSSDAPADPATLAAAAESRQVRRSLEEFHFAGKKEAVEKAWPHLGDADRYISSAARIAIEHQLFSQWRDRALGETGADAHLTALVAFARLARSGDQDRWGEAIASFKFKELSKPEQLSLLRAAALGLMRLEPIQPATRTRLLAAFDPLYPADDADLNRELTSLLVRLRAEKIIPRMLTCLEQAATQEEAIDVAVALSAVRDGWTIEERTRLLDWFDKSVSMAGGHSFFGYLVAARQRFIVGFPSQHRAALSERVAKPLVEQSPEQVSQSRPFVREWALDELVDLVDKTSTPRNFALGRRMFSAASCYNCHRIAGEGSAVGPDLTGVGGRFGVRDLLRAIVEPNHQISDQYQQMTFETNGRIIVGRVSNLSEDTIQVSTNMLDPDKIEKIPRSELDDQYPSKVSMMPAGLLNSLSGEEVLDLVAFLRAGGSSQNDIYSAKAPASGAAAP